GDPDFEGKMRRKGPNGFADFRNALRDLALKFGKPVLFVNGDTHLYKLDQPIADPATGRPLQNFTRVVVFGSPQTRWVRAGISPSSPQLFQVSPAPQSTPRPYPCISPRGPPRWRPMRSMRSPIATRTLSLCPAS